MILDTQVETSQYKCDKFVTNFALSKYTSDMAVFAFEFWKRVDELKGDMFLQELAEKAGLNYRTMRNQRSRCTFPKPADMQAIAKVLGTTQEYLMTGLGSPNVTTPKQEGTPCFSPEALAVENDDRLKALVRACLRDPRLLDVISAVVESSERTLGKQA